jgi:hypothetical protein
MGSWVRSVTRESTIYAPPELKSKIKELSERTSKPQWKIVLEALAMYESTLRKPRAKEELPVVDKVTWYIQKVAMSVGALKENPSEENLARTLNTIRQVKERLLVDTDLLERAVLDYVKLVKSSVEDAVAKHKIIDEARLELNMALKSLLLEIVYKWILKEELRGEHAVEAEAQGQ